jgi:alcohol dehydrogenase, propanol-preferring
MCSAARLTYEQVQDAREGRQDDDAVREHETVAPVPKLTGHDAISRQDGGEDREPRIGGVRGEDEDESGHRLDNVEERSPAEDRQRYLGYEGDRVLASLDITCGACHYCRAGKLDYCDNLKRLGLEHDGAFAEVVRLPAANLFPVPDAIPFPEAATIPDAVGCPYHAVMHHAKVRPAQTVAVYGLGGLGLTAVQVARLAGASVIAIARTPERRRLAEGLGATWSIDPRDAPVSEQVRDLTGGLGVDAFFDFVGIEGSVEQGVLASRKGGHVVVVGYVVSEVVAPMVRLVYNEVSITGSRSSTRADLQAAIDLVAQGSLRPVIGREFGLSDVNEALDELRAGNIIGRPVVTFPG